MSEPRILFMGTPDIAARTMEHLISRDRNIIGAVCQPDKPAGRGNKLRAPEVKESALTHGIPVYQPLTLRDGAFTELVRTLAPDLCVVVAYGKILPPGFLAVPPLGCINLHVSLLPYYRGSAPMQRAVMAGETETGVTVMYMDEGMDTGDIISQHRYPILPEDDFGTVYENAILYGGPLLDKAISDIYEGRASRIAQDHSLATYAHKIEKSECPLDFSLDAHTLLCRIRGLSPMPLANCRTPSGKLMKVLHAAVAEGSGRPGEVIDISLSGEGHITVACGAGALRIDSVIPEGKGKMTASAYLRGNRIGLGEVFS